MSGGQVGYRLDFLLGVSVPGNTYGSGQYGTGLYGTRPSDDIGSLRYRLVPLIPSGGASSMDDPDITVVRGDQLPTLTVKLIGDNDVGLNLTGTQVFFHSRPIDGGPDDWRSGGCAIVDAANGIVNYDWTQADTFLAGEYLGEFEVVYASGRRLTIPTIGKLRLHVPDDIFDSNPGDPARGPAVAHYLYVGSATADPGDGGINVATSTLSIAITDDDGIDRRNALLDLVAGDEVVLSNGITELARYEVTGDPVDVAVYFQVPVRVVWSRPSWPPAADTRLTIDVQPAAVAVA